MNVNKNNFQKESSIISESDIVFDKDKEIKYKRGKRLGVGGFGEVYEFIEIDTNEKRAAKIISNSRIDDPQSQNAFFYEKKFNELLGFKYLCKCYNIFNDDKNTYFILEYMKNKTLNELNEKRRLSELEIKHYCFELLLAIEYLHKMNIIHRDIKLSNVLINENMEIRLCDFGLAIDNGIKEQKNICGTLNYIAPELYNKRGGGLKYSFKTDIWAFGVLMYSLFFHKAPFKKEPKKKIDFNIQNIEANFPKGISISKEAKDLLKKILVKDPNSRARIEDIKSSSFFNNGKGIPKYLPESTLEKPMTKDEETKFVHNAILKGECLDKDCDLPDRVANRRHYSERNEMESNFEQEHDHDDSIIKEEEEENKSTEEDNITNKGNKNNNFEDNYIYKNNLKENENNIEVQIDKNRPRKSISFSNIIIVRNMSGEDMNKKLKLQNNETKEKINDIQDSNKKIDKNVNIYKKEEEKQDSDENKKYKKTKKENEEIKNIKGRNEIKIYNKPNNKEIFENDKNNYNENEVKTKSRTSLNKISIRIKENNNIIINKFIDLSDKCGIGYILTNDDIGACFNDGTNILRIKNTSNFLYINEKGNQKIINIKKESLDKEEKTKVNALYLFYKEFFKNIKNKNISKSTNNNQTADLLVNKWMKSQYAYFFLLSNNKVQIIFEDKSQIIFDLNQKQISFISKLKEIFTQNIENNKFESKEIEQKVKYAKRILKKMG